MEIFIDAEETLKGIQKGSLIVVDVRPFSKYPRAHIPRAIWLYIWDFTEHERGMPSKPKDPLEIARILGKNGLSREDHIVIAYDKNNIGIASYLYWYLEYMGQQEIHLLKGGMEEWELKQLPLEKGIVKLQPKEYKPIIKHEIRSSLEEILKALKEGDTLIVDVRTYDEHVGKLQTTPRPGRIPKSVLIEPIIFVKALQGDVNAITELSRIFNIANKKKVITYCSTGERAALAWLVLKKIIKINNVKLYPESFYEYSSRSDLEIEIGPPSVI